MKPPQNFTSNGQTAPEIGDHWQSVNELRRAIENSRVSIADAQRVSVEASRVLSLGATSGRLPKRAALESWFRDRGRPVGRKS